MNGKRCAAVAVVVVTLAGCMSPQDHADKVYAQHEQEQRNAAAQDAAYKAECARRDEEQAKAREERQRAAQAQRDDFTARRDAAVKNPQAATVVDLVNGLEPFEKKAVTVRGTWLGFRPDQEMTGYENYVNMAVAPSFKTKPMLGVFLEREEFQRRRDFYAGVKSAGVEAVLYIEDGQAYVVSVKAR